MGVRRILPPAKHSRKVERPRTRTLTSVGGKNNTTNSVALFLVSSFLVDAVQCMRAVNVEGRGGLPCSTRP